MTENDLEHASFDDIPSAPPCAPDGDYTVTIKGPELRTSKNTNSRYISYSAVVASGPDAGHTIFSMFSLKPQAFWRFKQAVSPLPIVVSPGATPIEAVEEILPQLDGMQVRVKVGSRVRQVQDEDEGGYIDDPEGNRENTIKKWLGPAI